MEIHSSQPARSRRHHKLMMMIIMIMMIMMMMLMMLMMMTMLMLMTMLMMIVIMMIISSWSEEYPTKFVLLSHFSCNAKGLRWKITYCSHLKKIWAMHYSHKQPYILSQGVIAQLLCKITIKTNKI